MKSRFMTSQQLFRPKCLLTQWTLWTRDTFNVILNSERMSVVVVVMLLLCLKYSLFADNTSLWGNTLLWSLVTRLTSWRQSDALMF